MSDQMQRRDFLKTTVLATGSLWLAGASTAGALTTYDQVDKSLFRGINLPANPAKLTALEKKHVPVIEAPDRVKAGEPFAVTVTVGETIHPMIPEHFIHDIEVFAGNEPAGRVRMAPELNHPQATFYLTLDRPATLVVREYCNLHGLWQSEKEVAIG